jgi:NitT/TauT family transport system substrate-binding protein
LDGKVEAAVLYNPFVNETQASGKARPLFSSKDMPGLVADVLAVSEKSLKDKRAEYVGIVKAWFDTENFLRSNRDEAVAIMAKVVKQQPSQYKIFLPSVRFLGAKDNLDSFAGASNPKSLTAVAVPIAKFLSENQLLKGAVEPAKALDDSLVKEAAR